MNDIKEEILKKSITKDWIDCRFIVPGYIDEVRATASKNPLIDFRHYEYLKGKAI